MTRYSHPLAGALLLTAIGTPSAVFAQATPAVAECTSINADSERLACYDRASGRSAAPPASDKPAAATPPAVAIAQPAAGALRAPASLIDTAWGFTPDSDRYVIDLYRQNYLLFARYTDNLNAAPYQSLFQAADQQETLDDTEAKFQISFKMRLWTTDDRK